MYQKGAFGAPGVSHRGKMSLYTVCGRLRGFWRSDPVMRTEMGGFRGPILYADGTDPKTEVVSIVLTETTEKCKDRNRKFGYNLPRH